MEREKELREFLDSWKPKPKAGLSRFISNRKELYEELMSSEWFGHTDNLTENLHHYYNGLNDVPICPICQTRKRKFVGYTVGYGTSCGCQDCVRKLKKGMRSGVDAEVYKPKRLKTKGISYLDKMVTIYQHQKNGMKGLVVKLRYDGELVQELIEKTSFLPDDASVSERLWYYINHLTEIQLCPYCKEKRRRFYKMDKGLFPTCGDKKCQSKGIIIGNQKPREWKPILEKMRKTYFARTGYWHTRYNPQAEEKRQKTLFEKYGVTCSYQTPTANYLRRKTIMERYGSVWEMMKQGAIKMYGSLSEKSKVHAYKYAEKIRKTKFKNLLEKIEKFDMEILFSYDENSHFRMRCKECGHEFDISRQGINDYYRLNLRFCPKCNYKNLRFRSHGERELYNTIATMVGDDVDIYNNKHIGGYECDVVVPSLKLAFDFNGVYYHTEYFKPKRIHQWKKVKVEEEGYQFIQIWEDDWNDPTKRDIILSRIKSKLGLTERIYARDTIFREVNGSEYRKFLMNNHLQGYIPSTYKFGLYYKDELVELVTLGKARSMISSSDEKGLELYRLCTKKGYTVLGGFSKLLKHISEQIDLTDMFSYADCDWCPIINSGYEKIGFVLDKITVPDYSYNVDDHRRNRMLYTKQKVLKLFNENPQKTEVQIMHERGYYRVFGSGNILFRYNPNHGCVSHKVMDVLEEIPNKEDIRKSKQKKK